MNFITKYYLFSLFSSADFTRGLHLVYILNLGFTNFYTGWLQFILFVASFLFEIPSGYLADKFKRKYSLLAGTLCFILSALIYLVSQTYFLISVLYLLQGIGFALYSGANEALLYQKVTNNNSTENDYYYYLAKSRMISTYSLTISIFIGSIFVLYGGYVLVFLGFLATNIAAFLSVLSFSEEYNTDNQTDITVSVTFKSIKVVFFDNFSLIFSLALVESVHTPYFVFFQNYLQDMGVSATFISSVIFLVTLFGAVSYKISPYLKNVSVYTFMWATTLILGLLLSIHFIDLEWYIYLFIFFLVNTIPNLLFVRTDDVLAGLVGDKIRATFLSWVSLINSIMISISYLLLGYLFDILGTKFTLGLLIIPISVSCILIVMKKNYINEHIQDEA